MTHDFGLRGHAVGFVDDDDIPAAAGHRAEVHAPQQVPVEADGSAYFEAPVGDPIYFQAGDQHGTAVPSMRSASLQADRRPTDGVLAFLLGAPYDSGLRHG